VIRIRSRCACSTNALRRAFASFKPISFTGSPPSSCVPAYAGRPGR
jgi:hypothetical protein